MLTAATLVHGKIGDRTIQHIFVLAYLCQDSCSNMAEGMRLISCWSDCQYYSMLINHRYSFLYMISWVEHHSQINRVSFIQVSDICENVGVTLHSLVPPGLLLANVCAYVFHYTDYVEHGPRCDISVVKIPVYTCTCNLPHFGGIEYYYITLEHHFSWPFGQYSSYFLHIWWVKMWVVLYLFGGGFS